MKTPKQRSATEAVAQELRRVVLSEEPGTLIGSEDALIARLASSRSTVRQVARLLEREGLLKVRRGINGGYFGARPDAGTIEGAVTTYLEALDIDIRDLTDIASVLWVEAVGRAAGAGSDARAAVIGGLRKRVKAIRDGATFEQVRDVELRTQTALFDLARSPYIKLLFDINVAYSRRRLSGVTPDHDPAAQAAFVQTWRDAKLLELGAVESGNCQLAAMAARHSRDVWYHRVLARFHELTPEQPRLNDGANLNAR